MRKTRIVKWNLCEKDCTDSGHCNRDRYKGNCHLTITFGELAAFGNPQSLLKGMWRAGFRFNQNTKSFEIRS
jgi:hypothetical protein